MQNNSSNTMREGAQEVLVRAQLDQVSVRDRKPGAAYPPYPGVDSPYDAGIEPRSVKIQSEYKAARAAGRPGGSGDFWYWLAENYPPPPGDAVAPTPVPAARPVPTPVPAAMPVSTRALSAGVDGLDVALARLVARRHGVEVASHAFPAAHAAAVAPTPVPAARPVPTPVPAAMPVSTRALSAGVDGLDVALARLVARRHGVEVASHAFPAAHAALASPFAADGVEGAIGRLIARNGCAEGLDAAVARLVARNGCAEGLDAAVARLVESQCRSF